MTNFKILYVSILFLIQINFLNFSRELIILRGIHQLWVLLLWLHCWVQ